MNTLTDIELEQRAADGERDAFGELYERYSARVFDFLLRMVREPAEAADLAQETFVRAMRSLSVERAGKAEFATWLFTIARNLALTRMERAKRTTPLVTDDEDESEYYALDAELLDNDPERMAQAGEIVALVWAASEALEPKQRTLLDLHVRQGLDSAEIAGVLGVSKGNAYTMMSRLKDTFESAVAGLVMFRSGRRACDELNALLERNGATQMTPEVRKLIERHTDACATCQGKRRELVSASALLRAMVPLPLMPDLASRLRDGAWAQSQAASAAGASSAGGSAAHGAPASASGGHGGAMSLPARMLQALPGPAWLPAVAAIAVVGVAVPAVVFAMQMGGGGDAQSRSSVAAEERGVTPTVATTSATAPAIVPASPPIAPGGVTSGGTSNVAADANADGAYNLALPPGDGMCGFPSIDGARLEIHGGTATLTSLNGGVVSGTATVTGQQLDVHMTGRGGQWIVDLTGGLDAAGNYSGQSKNDGATGQSGFACHFAFTAYTSTPHAVDPSGACPDAGTLWAVWQGSPAAAQSPTVTGFANVSCWSTWVLAAALGQANGQARFSTVPALHVAMDETPAFIAAVCAGADAPASWRARVTCPAAPAAQATGDDRDQLRAAILRHSPGMMFDPNCVPDEAGSCMTGEWPAEMLASGIATGPGGGAATFYGRHADGTWEYWFGTQNSGGPQTRLPGDMLVCADGDGLNLRSDPSTSAAMVTLIPDGTVVRGDRFVMTDAPSPGGTSQPHPDGWYHITSPQEGWAYDRYLLAYPVVPQAPGTCIDTWWP